MSTDYQRVLDFHNTFGVKSVWKDPAAIDQQVVKFRWDLIDEEAHKELKPAFQAFFYSPTLENLTELADGLVDSVYVLLGAAIAFDLPWEELFVEVQRSNMAKVWPDGTVHRREDGKILKPDGWTPPDLFSILMNWQEKRILAAEKPLTQLETITPEEKQRLIRRWKGLPENPTAEQLAEENSANPATAPRQE